MKIKDGFLLRQVAGVNMVIPIGQASVNFNAMITLNDSGTFLWNCLEDDLSADELIKKMLDEYEVDSATAKSDVYEFIDRLKQADILED